MSKLLNTAMLLAFAGLLGPHPAPASSGQYQPGTSYLYDYETVVRLNEDPQVTRTQGREVGYKVKGQVKVTNVWQNNPSEKLLKLELGKLKLLVHSVNTKDHHWQAHKSPLDKKSLLPAVFLHWKNGDSPTVYVPTSLDRDTANLYKGVAGLFQVQQQNGDATETDVSGQCQVTYRASGGKIVKTKTGCSYAGASQFRHPNHVQSAKLSEETYVTYEFNSDATIKWASSVTKLTFGVRLWRRASVAVFSETILNFVADQKGEKVTEAPTVQEALKNEEKSPLRQETLMAVAVEAKCGGSSKCKTLQNVVKSYRENLKLKSLATVKSANAFVKVMDRIRLATKEEIVAVLKDAKNKNVLPQLLDATAAAQTDAAFEAAASVLNFNSADELDFPERFLMCLSAVGHPSDSLLNSVLELAKTPLKSEKIRATVLTTLGSLVRTSWRNNGKTGSKILDAISTFLQMELDGCKTDLCKRMYMQGLVNAGLPETVDILMTHVKNGGKLGIVAMTALKRLSLTGDLDNRYLDELRQVFLQLKKPYDSLIRTGAAEILFRQFRESDVIVRDFIATLSQPKDAPEVKAYTMAKLRDLAGEDEGLREAVRKISKNPHLWNYYVLSLAGSSTSFRRTLARGYALNGTYGVNVELAPGGLMKRSSFEINLKSGDDPLQLLQLGLFADGISGITDSNSDSEQEEAATAGMELTVLDIKIRPYTFFTGTGELMGMVWSGTGSEPTPALQANFLMMDQRVLVPLPNGLPVELRLSGALSSDLTGSIQVSLWNRNSHAVVNSKGALLVHGTANVETFFAKGQMEFAIGGEARLDCTTDLEFYEKPYKMCIQLDQPGFDFRYNVRKAESVPGSKHLIRTLKKKSVSVPGRSFDLERKNSEQCAKLLVDDS